MAQKNLKTVIRRLSDGKVYMEKVVGVSSVALGVEIQKGEDTKVVPVDEGDFSECPECGSTDIQYDVKGIEPEAIFVFRVHSCSNCGTTWEERYDLTTVKITPVINNNNGRGVE